MGMDKTLASFWDWYHCRYRTTPLTAHMVESLAEGTEASVILSKPSWISVSTEIALISCSVARPTLPVVPITNPLKRPVHGQS